MIILLSLYAIAMGVATIVETKFSTLTARTLFYNSWWFILLQMVMVINFVAMSVRFQLIKQHKWGALTLHYAMVIILLGALITHVTGREGVMHIREGQSSNTLYNPQGEVIATLPFSVTLTDFRLVRYGGSGSPSSFESDVVINGVAEKIYMNNIVYRDGYRLYQSSYDHDEKGTILSVNQDAVGTAVTYIGYALLVLGMILSLAHRNSRFRTLFRQLTILTLMVAGGTAIAQKITPAQGALAIEYAQNAALDPVTSEQFGKLLVQTTGGRIEPVDTYSGKLLRKIARQESFAGLSANQVLIGMVTAPEIWSQVPIIKSGSEMIAFADVLDSAGNYRYTDQVAKIYEKAVNERNKSDKDLLKLDEKVNIMHALFSGEMLAIFPLEGDPTHKWYSPADELSTFRGQDSMFVNRIFVWFGTEVRKGNSEQVAKVIDMISTYQQSKATDVLIGQKQIDAEILYNRIDVFKWAAFSLMGLGLLLLITVIINLLRSTLTLRRTIGILSALIIIVFLWHTFGIGLRWYISGRAPMSNAYESMVYVAWATVLAGILFVRRSRMTLSLAAFMGGVILFVTNLNFMDPEITQLVPVLKSYWLMIHVAVITGSYGFFGIGFLLGIISLIMMCTSDHRLDKQIRELYIINFLTLTIGLVLLTAGTFLGAVWANESWGRYWGWDPKETWALITMIIYAIILHSHLIPRFATPFNFAVMSIIGLSSVLMTFFGVNYYLSGLHSYGADSAPEALSWLYVIYFALILLIGCAWWRVRVKSHSATQDLDSDLS